MPIIRVLGVDGEFSVAVLIVARSSSLAFSARSFSAMRIAGRAMGRNSKRVEATHTVFRHVSTVKYMCNTLPILPGPWGGGAAVGGARSSSWKYNSPNSKVLLS